MSTIFLLRFITWVMIVANWVLILWLNRLLKRANRDFWKAANDANHYATLAVFTQMTLQQVAPGTRVPIPPETLDWMEAKALDHMVYGDEAPPHSSSTDGG